MSKYLSPTDIQTTFSIKKTFTYQLLKEFEKQGGEVIRIGQRTRRVSEEEFTKFLRGKNENS